MLRGLISPHRLRKIKKKEIKGWLSTSPLLFFWKKKTKNNNLTIPVEKAKTSPFSFFSKKLKKFICAATSDRIFSDRFCCLSQLSGMSGHFLSHQPRCGCICTRGDVRGGALTLSHPTQNAIKWERTGYFPPLLLPSPSLQEVEIDWSRWPLAGGVCSAHPPSCHLFSHSFCSVGLCGRRTSEPPSAASRLQDFPPCSPAASLSWGSAFLYLVDDVEFSQYASF